MPCYFPMQATFSIREDGKKKIDFSSATAAKLFYSGSVYKIDNQIALPCGKCIGCRLERSRQWAVRIMHEASLHDKNCFITLTYSDDYLPKDGSIHREDVQKFVKRLRRKFHERKIRLFYCGEYGDHFSRPHYHMCLFNVDFDDKVYLFSKEGNKIFRSELLERLWPYGISTIGDLTFESAAYVARYCTKKVNGALANEHYNGRCPEFGQASLKPAIGKDWYDKFGKTDVVPFDEVVVRGKKTKPPRYYDKLTERDDPEVMDSIKVSREKRGVLNSVNCTFKRLQTRMKCKSAVLKNISRSFENGDD